MENFEEMYRNGLKYETEENYEQAFACFKKAAENDDHDAEYKLGLYYLNGIYVSRNIDDALAFLKSSSDGGVTEAGRELFKLYFEGTEVQEDIEKATVFYDRIADADPPEKCLETADVMLKKSDSGKVKAYAARWMMKALTEMAENGDSRGDYLLAREYMSGRCFNRSEKIAVKYLKKAANQGNTDAMLELGDIGLSGNENFSNEDGIAMIRKAAEAGDPEGQYKLGYLYLDGVLKEKDEESHSEGIKWVLASANQNYASAQALTGLLYENSGEEGYVQAEEWYRKAAEQNLPDGQYMLACFLLNHAANRCTEAFDLLIEAAAGGYTDAQDKLLELRNSEDFRKYCAESDCNELLKAAEACIENDDTSGYLRNLVIASLKGHSEAQFKLGSFYEDAGDEDTSMKWYSLSADNGHSRAKTMLGLKYLSGDGVEQDQKKGFRLLENAAKEGIAQAQYMTGRCYLNGDGVGKDIGKAISWLKKADGQNFYQAAYMLGVMYLNNGNDIDGKFYLEKAAGHGHAEAQYRLAVSYYSDFDTARTLELLEKSAAQGNKDAALKLKEIKENEDRKRLEEERRQRQRLEQENDTGFYDVPDDEISGEGKRTEILRKLLKIAIALLLAAAVIFAAKRLLSGNRSEKTAGHAASDTAEVSIEAIRAAQTGDIVTFGSYEQDKNYDNGEEEIEWIVLEKEDDSVLLISRYVLDVQPYHGADRDVTWETCSLRDWLNSTFKENAFSENEAELIMVSDLDNGGYGENTEDQLFLLSADEAAEYFTDDDARKAEKTAYTNISTDYVMDGCCIWWLRTRGSADDTAKVVIATGTIVPGGSEVDFTTIGVRPAMRVSVK